MTIDPREFRAALGCFATGIAVATARPAQGAPVGITINSFASVSLDPPLVLWSIARTATRFAAFRDAGHFAVNVLREEQRELSVRFSGPADDCWDGIAVERWTTGAPVIAGSLAVIECATESVYEGGDHLILVGRVLRLASDRGGRPLVYFAGRYAGLC
ncbi:flavin reductase family protein [Arenibaculum sp.]|uniref:flavin reductase family protein n=1 Tax=Arenibaculum sp. TaxID=2865862 RepID=UPI002E114C28|nr:flavin reductase family protein [Arenibaculum sp.]